MSILRDIDPTVYGVCLIIIVCAVTAWGITLTSKTEAAPQPKFENFTVIDGLPGNVVAFCFLGNLYLYSSEGSIAATGDTCHNEPSLNQ